jgi:hypothetical protein
MSIQSLPKKLHEKIHQNFDGSAHRNMAMTCRHWNGLCVEIETNDKDLWMNFLVKKFPDYQIKTNVPLKQQYKLEQEVRFIIDNYPSSLYAAFGGPVAFAKLPLRINGMEARAMRTFTHSVMTNKNHPGVDVRIEDKVTRRQGIVSIQEDYIGPLAQRYGWKAFSSPDLGVYFFAKAPNHPSLPDFSIDIEKASRRLEKMLNGTDPSFAVV